MSTTSITDQTPNASDWAAQVALSRTSLSEACPELYTKYLDATEKLERSLSKAEKQITSAYDLDDPSHPDICLTVASVHLKAAVNHLQGVSQSILDLTHSKNFAQGHMPYFSLCETAWTESGRRLDTCLSKCSVGSLMVAKMFKVHDVDGDSGMSQEATVASMTRLHADAQRLESLVQSTKGAFTR